MSTSVKGRIYNSLIMSKQLRKKYEKTLLMKSLKRSRYSWKQIKRRNDKIQNLIMT
jgi:hypothetical protein